MESLTRALPREMTLEEMAMDYDQRVDPRGGVKVVKYVNQKKLRAAVKELNQRGKDAMRPFVDWCIEEYGASEDWAYKTALAIWRSIHENPEDPAACLLDKDRYTYVERVTLKKGFTRFSAWMIETAEDPEHIDYAKKMINRLQEIPCTKVNREPKRLYTSNEKVRPITAEQMGEVMKAVEIYSMQNRGKHPWLRPIIRFALLTGQTYPYDFVQLEREHIQEEIAAYEKGNKAAAVSIWGTKLRARRVPIVMAYEELKTLVNWVYPWGTLSEVVSPVSNLPNRASRKQIADHLRKALAQAELDLGKHSGRNIKAYLIKKIWDETHDFLLLDSLFGYTIRQAKRIKYLNIPIATFPE